MKSTVSRKDFSEAEIRQALSEGDDNFRKAAEVLTALGRGKVSRQLVRNWVVRDPDPRTKKNCHTSMKEKNAAAAQDGPKVLFLDIETSPIEGRVWGLWKQNVGLNQITKEWNILSYCAKWLGSDDVIYSDLSEASNIADDRKLVDELYVLLNEADLVVVQNGKRFDIPKINARFILQGHTPPRPFKIIDTLLIAKQQFGFTSNKLEWMTDKLCKTKKRKHEKFPGMELWNQCLAGNPEAWEEMRLYNIDDVVSLEELYLLMRPWYVGHPNVSIYRGRNHKSCPKCGSSDLRRDGWVYTQAGKYELYQCGGCHGWARGRYTRNTKEERYAQLSN